MSVVSAGGRRGPVRDRPPPPRDFRSIPKTRRGYSHSDIGEPFIPRFSALSSEGPVKLSLPAEEWAETTTVLTGVTNDSYTGEESTKKVFEAPIGRVVSRRCSRVLWLGIASIISLLAIFSPLAMVGIPFGMTYFGYTYPQVTCEVDCQGYLLQVVIKTMLLTVAIWALYWRRAVADFPRLYVARASLAMFTLFILFAFWLFYSVRIVMERYGNYPYIVDYARSLLDSLLCTHYISLIVLYIRSLRCEYTITIIRDPDGESKTMSVGIMSLQEAAIQVLRFYETSFPSYNDLLDKARFGGSLTRRGMNPPNAGFKMYDIEGLGGVAGGREAISEVNTRALLEAAARRRYPGHNEIMREQEEWERRVNKRKFRLMAAAEDGFAHVQAVQDMQHLKSLTEPMGSNSAAETVFTFIARPLTKFLKVTRQHQKHSSEAIKKYIEICLSLRLGYRTFLQRYFSDRYPSQESVGESKWSIICEDQASVPLKHGSMFLLRSHTKDDNAGVQLLCTVNVLPFFNLTEQSPSAASKFALKITSESPV